MKKFKLAISVLLAAVMLLGIMPLGVFAVTVISEVNVTVEKFPILGLTADDLPEPTVAPDCGYTIDRFEWYDNEADDIMYETDRFVSGRNYQLYVHLVPSEGYKFSSSVTAKVNSSTDDVWHVYEFKADSGYFWTRRTTAAAPTEPALIKNVNVLGYRIPKAGQTASENLSSLTVPDEAPYRIVTEPRTTHWQIIHSTEKAMKPDEKFEISNEIIYYISIVIEPLDGYYFDESAIPSVLFNGTFDGVDDAKTAVTSEGKLNCFGLYANAEPPVISAVNVNVDRYPVIGLTPLDMPFPYVDENCGYYIETWYWYDDTMGYPNGSHPYQDPFEKGHSYRLFVYLKPTDGNTFSDEMSVTVNETTEQLWPFYSFEEDGGYLWTVSRSAIQQAITDDVRIDGLCIPRIGQTAAENLSKIELAPDANYHISEIYWRCVAGELNDDDKFEAGKKYYLVVRLAPNDDYCFDEDNAPDVYMNGTDDYIDKEYTFVLDDGTLGFFTVEFTPLEVISSASVGGFVPPMVGKSAKEAQYPTVFVELPYEIGFMGWFDETESEYLEPDDVFVKGVKYSFCVELCPKEGYTFADTVVATINGSADLVDTNSTCANFDGTFSLWSVPDYALYFGENEKVWAINVDVNEFPVVGVRAGDLADPVCKTQYGYEIAESYWFNDTDHVPMDVDDVFAADKSYSLYVRAVPVPGFEYGDSVYLTVNSLSELVESEFSFVAPDCAGIWTVSRPAVLYGDVNGDRVVNLKDATLIRRFYVGGWDVVLDEALADVNHDGVVNLKDATLIRRYYVGGWGVVLGQQS